VAHDVHLDRALNPPNYHTFTTRPAKRRMLLLFTPLSKLRNCFRRNTISPKTSARQLDCEALEDRTTPTASTISANFNGVAIPAGDYLWFSSVAKVSGLGSKPVTVDLTNETISFTAKGTQYSLAVPNSTIVFNPKTEKASTSFGAAGWSVSVPSDLSGNVFLDGLGWQAPKNLPGGIKDVTWSGDFSTATPGIKVSWEWSAAVYSEFTSNMSAIEVKTVPNKKEDAFKNSDRAGTPENFKSFVVAGARGVGHSDWTGNESRTAAVHIAAQSGTAVISGNIAYTMLGDGAGPAVGDTVTLTNSSGVVVASTPTDGSGDYSFGSLPAGTYSVTVFDSDLNGGSESISVAVTNGQTSSGNDFLINE
jgi:hypothetical protein